MSLKPGKYFAIAKAARFGNSETAKKTPGVAVDFEITQGESKGQKITYVGWFSGGATEYTFQNLVKAGYNEALDNPLQNAKEVEIVLEEETYEGKTRTKVKYINEPGKGGGKFAEASPTSLGFDLKQMMASARAQLGQSAPVDENNNEDVPY